MSGFEPDNDWTRNDYQPQASGSPGLWLGLSIAATLCCCWPFGIPGIVYAAMAINDRKYGREGYEYDGHLSKARGWTIASIVCGFILEGILVLVQYNRLRNGGTTY
jgi:hypothetical protein